MRTEGIISNWGNGKAVRIPKIMLDSLGLSANDKIEISIVENKIMIEPTTKRKIKTLSERFEGYTGDYQPMEWDTGQPVGSEIF